jgi:very-short-patch-repair endonuclease
MARCISNAKRRTAARDSWLAGQGVRTLRFTTDDLELRPAVVIATIRDVAAPSTA